MHLNVVWRDVICGYHGANIKKLVKMVKRIFILPSTKLFCFHHQSEQRVNAEVSNSGGESNTTLKNIGTRISEIPIELWIASPISYSTSLVVLETGEDGSDPKDNCSKFSKAFARYGQYLNLYAKLVNYEIFFSYNTTKLSRGLTNNNHNKKI